MVATVRHQNCAAKSSSACGSIADNCTPCNLTIFPLWFYCKPTENFLFLAWKSNHDHYSLLPVGCV